MRRDFPVDFWIVFIMSFFKKIIITYREKCIRVWLDDQPCVYFGCLDVWIVRVETE